MNSIKVVKDQLKTIRSIDDAFCIGVLLWRDTKLCSEDVFMLEVMKTNKEDFLKKVINNYMVLIKKDNFAKDYRRVFEGIFEVRSNIKEYIKNYNGICEELKTFLCYEVLDDIKDE